ncbi:uncharacterized protein LOC114464222 [Gouania willdenowi]|uniref:uncharacterized protein LOC114464222 n=1 Tax=Gouania willdenowi TaxID=441366 RepID=UPI001055D40F|nr:uncharacterized protein LOC114464222 [Gouania willdenowi]
MRSLEPTLMLVEWTEQVGKEERLKLLCKVFSPGVLDAFVCLFIFGKPVTTPKKKQGPTPSRKGPRSLKFQSSQATCTEESDEPFSSPASVSSAASSVASSSSSTVILEKSTPSTSTSQEVDLFSAIESPQSQARHYKTLQDLYKTKNKPNKEDVSQLLELEFQSRRAFIDSDVMKEQDRPMKILQAYPCFKELGHIIDELQ